MLGTPSLAQNTKGDKPAAPTSRETRFKTPKPSKQKTKPRRFKGRGDKPGAPAVALPSRSRKGEQAGKPVAPNFHRTKPNAKQRAWRGDITGQRVQPRSSASRARNVYPQPEYTNYSSRDLKRILQNNDNPNVKRVRRLQRQNASRSRVGRPIKPVYTKSKPRDKQKAWRGDISGRPVRSRVPGGMSESGVTEEAPAGVRTQKRNLAKNRSILSGTSSGRAGKNHPAGGFYRNRAGRSRYQVSQSSFFNLTPARTGRVSGRKIVPRSASAAYLAKKSTNTWAHFKRPKRRQERAYTTDLAGKKLRTRNFETQRPELINLTLHYTRRAAAGERPYRGPAAGSYVSKTRVGQRAWKGDVARRALRAGKSPRSAERAFSGLLKGGGFQSATSHGERKQGLPIPVKKPGIEAAGIGKYRGNISMNQRKGFGNQGEEYSGNIRAKRILKGSGSISRARWNNRGTPIQGKSPGRGADRIGKFQGNLRSGRRGFNDQGEQYAGNIKAHGRRGFNNQGEGSTGNIKAVRRGFSNQGEEYSGNMKMRRLQKGGGSRSGEHWNNKGTPVLVKVPKGKSAGMAGYQGNLRGDRKGFRDQGEEYTGNIKTRRPDKGGGSVSGKLWNNNESPVRGKDFSGDVVRVSRFSGHIKAKRPEKGGGSVSGKLWNNDESPIRGKDFSGDVVRVSRFSGHVKAKRPEKGGGSVSGKLWNNDESPIRGKDFSGDVVRVSRFSGHIKAKRPEKGGGSVSGKLWNNNETPIAVRIPKNAEDKNFSGNLKAARTGMNPRSSKEALPGVKPTNASVKAANFSRGTRRTWDYIRNSSASDESQRVREPGRAFARSTDYQGSIKIKRFDLFKKSALHPDAKFVKLNKNNVPEEKDAVTNFKLWWARLFKKSETQPDHLKENSRKPRYDKGESGLWYE
jgi:hypothetical protein